MWPKRPRASRGQKMHDVLSLVGVLAAQLFAAGAVYGAIRSDLKNAKECAKEAKQEAAQAHQRIDNILMKGA